MDARPLIGVTIGDPAGIGPEIVARAVGNPELHERARLLVVGDEAIMARAVALTGVDLVVRRVQAPGDGTYGAGTMDILDPLNLDLSDLELGAVQGRAGQAAYGYIKRAIEMAMAGEIDAMATAPINKEALQAGGVPYIDHTAMLADLTGSPDPMTVFVLGNLRIFFLTRHVALRKAIEQITAARVLESLGRVDGEMRRLGMESARIAVAGLNPHAGEGGLFGDEEIRELAPAVEAARARGLNVFGPVPPDSVFFQNALGKYDAVLSLYHDQGHIAAKTRDFERTVSVTVGIPFLRTSVDHGTAFDIAWKGTASAISMEEAIKVAADYAPLYRPLQPAG
jgi:4-phospho-D-threonate 3-dehydrogenase / 4-phospho-D-erythronate 3-dehydrogenase